MNMAVSISGLQNAIKSSGSNMTILTSDNVMDENSFQEPNKV